MNKIILIDFGAVQHSAIFAYRKNSSVPVTYTIMRMIIGYLKRFQVDMDDKVILCLDCGSWRKDIDIAYKSQRKKFREQFESEEWWKEIYKEIDEFVEKIDKSLCWYICKNYKAEADDWISVACRTFTDKEIIIVSFDRDLEQLCFYSNVKIFSPRTKKFKEVKNPAKVLLEKIQGDKSDNLLDKPSSEVEFEKRKEIVDLIDPLPDYIEKPLKEKLLSLMPKNICLERVPYNSVRQEIKKLYKI